MVRRSGYDKSEDVPAAENRVSSVKKKFIRRQEGISEKVTKMRAVLVWQKRLEQSFFAEMENTDLGQGTCSLIGHSVAARQR